MNDITDIVSRLRRTDENRGVAICSEAADTIEQLRKQNRESLLSRITAWLTGLLGKNDDYEQPIGLLNECAEEIKRLRAERDDARRMYCILRMRISNKPEATDTSQSLGWEGLWRGRSRHM